jgi:hypothetical protein
LIDLGSEFRLRRQWFDRCAKDEPLGLDFAVAEKDQLNPCLDRVAAAKRELFLHLKQRRQDLSARECDLLLFLKSPYGEGEADQIPKAKHGYSRDGRLDCKQVVVAPVVTPGGFPLAHEVTEGNTTNRTTLHAFLDEPGGPMARADGQG